MEGTQCRSRVDGVTNACLPVRRNPGGIVIYEMQHIAETKLNYFHVRVPSCTALLLALMRGRSTPPQPCEEKQRDRPTIASLCDTYNDNAGATVAKSLAHQYRVTIARWLQEPVCHAQPRLLHVCLPNHRVCFELSRCTKAHGSAGAHSRGP